MSFTLPDLQANTAKERVVSVLSRRFPLTAKQVFHGLKTEFGVNTSYQATHKLLNQMLEERTIVKTGQNYSLNREWISKVKKLGTSLENYYFRNSSRNYLEELEKNGAVNISLIGILETASFLINGFFRLPNPGKKANIALWKNVYSIVGLSEDHYTGLKNTLPGWHAISSEDSPVNRMFAQALEKYGMKVKLGVKEVATSLNDTFVCGDYVGIIWYPPKFRALWDEQNSVPKNFNEFDLQHHLKMMVDEKAEISMVITKNPVLAEQIREKYMAYFEGEKK